MVPTCINASFFENSARCCHSHVLTKIAPLRRALHDSSCVFRRCPMDRRIAGRRYGVYFLAVCMDARTAIRKIGVFGDSRRRGLACASKLSGRARERNTVTGGQRTYSCRIHSFLVCLIQIQYALPTPISLARSFRIQTS